MNDDLKSILRDIVAHLAFHVMSEDYAKGILKRIDALPTNNKAE